MKITHTSCYAMAFMSLVHSLSFSLVRRPTSILRYEWRENSTFQKVQETTHNSWFAMILMTPVHSARLSLVGRTSSIFRFGCRENPILEKVAETSQTSCFTMILMPLVHSSSFCIVRRKNIFLRHESLITRSCKSCQPHLKSPVYWEFRYRQYIL